MGITEDEATQSVVEAYIPVILLCDVDGYYIYYYDEFQDGSGNRAPKEDGLRRCRII
jgi:hypothetical protein